MMNAVVVGSGGCVNQCVACALSLCDASFQVGQMPCLLIEPFLRRGTDLRESFQTM